MRGGWLYILANRYRGTIYIGVTSDLPRRISQHREGTGSQFAADYNATLLVYAEPHDTIEAAIAREKAMKKWRRQWKIDLIETQNPDWQDRYIELIGL